MKVGDPITVCILRDDGMVFNEVVVRVDPDGDFVADHVERRRGGGNGSNESMSEEGVRWIRGHHTRESEEAQALLAAAILANSEKNRTMQWPHTDELGWLEKQ